MRSIWLNERDVTKRCARNEAFWEGCLDAGPLLWITVPHATRGVPPKAPATEEALWTDVEYVLDKGEYDLAHTHFAGDALPVFHPWLGPDQFSAWLGAEMELKPLENTSWIKRFVTDANAYPPFRIAPANRWWRLYLELVRGAVERGADKWVTAYPDLHTGIDALAAIRGPENLMMDLLENPDIVRRAMTQLTRLWKDIVDLVSALVLPAGQGTSNWTMGWSQRRFLCLGQNDFSCMISPEMFETFCWQDNRECCGHVEHTLYHLDGPGALRHVPLLLRLEQLDCIQWIQGAGKPLPSQWLDLLRQIQAGGKSIQLYYGGDHGGHADLKHELDLLCGALDPTRLFIWATVDSAETAEDIVRYSHRAGLRQSRKARKGSTRW
ncbi:MAG: hypothetical protein WCQ21_07460 [Verrucomicrobiota bacterium]